MMRSATSPVQPVWWEAPRPAPVSPSKYSKNSGVAPARVGLEPLGAAEDRAAAVRARQEQRDQARRSSSATSCRFVSTPAGRALHLEVVAEVHVVALERLDDEWFSGNHTGPRQLELPP